MGWLVVVLGVNADTREIGEFNLRTVWMAWAHCPRVNLVTQAFTAVLKSQPTGYGLDTTIVVVHALMCYVYMNTVLSPLPRAL